MPKQIIFLMTDSQRYDMVNCNVSTGLSTPCLDRLAASGTRFTRAYTTQPVCQPARAGIFTGMYPHSSGSWTNSMGVAENIHNAGERMQRMGVHTAYIGKWHLDGGDYFGLGRTPGQACRQKNQSLPLSTRNSSAPKSLSATWIGFFSSVILSPSHYPISKFHIMELSYHNPQTKSIPRHHQNIVRKIHKIIGLTFHGPVVYL